MILPGRAAHPPSVQLQARGSADARAAAATEAPPDRLADHRSGSMVAADSDAGATYPPQARPVSQLRPDASDAMGRVASGYVLRYADVGVALLQGPGGTHVVQPGSVVPDAGQIQSIEQRAGRWVVVTATGTIEGPRM
jgi:hypothetical protein